MGTVVKYVSVLLIYYIKTLFLVVVVTDFDVGNSLVVLNLL